MIENISKGRKRKIGHFGLVVKCPLFYALLTVFYSLLLVSVALSCFTRHSSLQNSRVSHGFFKIKKIHLSVCHGGYFYETQVLKKRYIVNYFTNSDKLLIILTNSGIWPFWPCFDHKILSFNWNEWWTNKRKIQFLLKWVVIAKIRDKSKEGLQKHENFQNLTWKLDR